MSIETTVTRATDVLDRLAGSATHEGPKATCQTCRLVSALRAVLNKCDAMEAEAPIGRFFAEEFRGVIDAALTPAPSLTADHTTTSEENRP